MEQLTYLDEPIVDHYHITTERACFRLIVHNGRVREPPPIARWARGQPITKVVAWYAKIGATVERVGEVRDERELSGADSDRQL